MVTIASSINAGIPDFVVARKARAAAQDAQSAIAKAARAAKAGRGDAAPSESRHDRKATGRRHVARAKAAAPSPLPPTLLTAPAAVNQAVAAGSTRATNGVPAGVPATPTIPPATASGVVSTSAPAPLAPASSPGQAVDARSTAGADRVPATPTVPPTLTSQEVRSPASPGQASAPTSQGNGNAVGASSAPAEAPARTGGYSSQSNGNAVWARGATTALSQRGNAPDFAQRDLGLGDPRSFTSGQQSASGKLRGLAYGHARRDTMQTRTVSMAELLFRPAASPLKSATPALGPQRFGDLGASTPLTSGGIALQVLSSWSSLRSSLESERASRALPGVSQYARSQTLGSGFSRGALNDRFL